MYGLGELFEVLFLGDEKVTPLTCLLSKFQKTIETLSHCSFAGGNETLVAETTSELRRISEITLTI